MANTIAQNCQRGIIFITFILFVLFFIVVVISLIKKLIDSSQDESGQQRYKEGGEKQNYQQSAEKFDHAAIDATEIKEEDTSIVKFLKKVKQLETRYFSLFILIPLNILTGTSKAFSFVFFFFILIVVLLVNVGKLHRKCCDHKCVVAILENLWIAMLFFELINVWGATTIMQPYIIVQG